MHAPNTKPYPYTWTYIAGLIYHMYHTHTPYYTYNMYNTQTAILLHIVKVTSQQVIGSY